MSFFTFPPNLTFFSTNLSIYAVQNVPTDHTDHFGFQQKIVRIWKNVTKKIDLGEKSLFEISVKKNDFIGRHMLLFLEVYIYIYILYIF